MNLGCFGQAKYLVDEAKDKNNRVLDVSKWESVFPQDIPEQLNGYIYLNSFVSFSELMSFAEHILLVVRCNKTEIKPEIL